MLASSEGGDRAASPESDREFSLRLVELLKAGHSFSGHERDFLAWNRRDGRFLEISGVTGADSPSDGRAAVYFDYDDDGDADIFLKAMHGPAHFLFRNDVGQDAAFVRVALRGTKSGRDAFGAVVRLKTSAGILARMKSGGAGYLSQNDPRLLFGLGKATRAEWLEIAWPSGLVERHPGPKAGESLLLVEGAGVGR
ncbi:MAG: ASPIC/UnbV domain-containing protein [Planctomycetaceae bacterium]